MLCWARRVFLRSLRLIGRTVSMITEPEPLAAMSTADLRAAFDGHDYPINTLHELDGNGDTKITWNPRNDGEVNAARAHFDALRTKGYLAYRTDGPDGGEAIRQFDPEAGM